ncbi:MAG TPA: hypothetical protein VIX81_12200 [Gammaproteobacteria bacterium]
MKRIGRHRAAAARCRITDPGARLRERVEVPVGHVHGAGSDQQESRASRVSAIASRRPQLDG